MANLRLAVFAAAAVGVLMERSVLRFLPSMAFDDEQRPVLCQPSHPRCEGVVDTG